MIAEAENYRIVFATAEISRADNKTIGGVVTVTLGVTLTLLGLKVIGSDDDLPQIGNDENVA